MAKILRSVVTGGAGFIGSNFVHYLLENYPNYEVLVYDKLTYAGNLENLRSAENNPNYHFIKGDITDAEAIDRLFAEEKFDYVVNFAAETHVSRSVNGRADDFVQTNVIGVYTLLEAVKKHSVPKYVQISTDEVFGTTQLHEDRKFGENSPFEPNVPYSAAKAGGDHLCRAYWHTYGVPVIVSHCSNNYGPFQHPEKMVPYFIFRAMNNQPITLHGNGQHIRDWIFVWDHCRAIDLIMHNGKPGEVYNVGADNEMHNIDIAEMILKLVGRPTNLVTFVPDRLGNDLRYAIDSSKINKELGWRPLSNFEDAMAKTIKWYQNNLDWVERIREKDRDFTKYNL